MSPLPGVDPPPGRFLVVSQWLRRTLFVVAGLAALTVVLPPSLGVWSGRALVALLVAVPLARVAWFVVRWFRRGGPRFALVGLGVLCVVTVGALLA